MILEFSVQWASSDHVFSTISNISVVFQVGVQSQVSFFRVTHLVF